VSELLKIKINIIKDLGEVDKAVDNIKNPKGFLHLYGDNLIRRMLKDGNSVEDIIVQILITSTGVVNLSPQVPRFHCHANCSSLKSSISICPTNIVMTGWISFVYQNLKTRVLSPS
jgi:hypothetical protein